MFNVADPTETIDLFGKQNGSGTAVIFNDDGHRLGAGFANAFVFRGWTHPNFQGCCNDWLLTAQPGDFDIPDAPEPSTYLMFLSGVALLWGMRRRRQS